MRRRWEHLGMMARSEVASPSPQLRNRRTESQSVSPDAGSLFSIRCLGSGPPASADEHHGIQRRSTDVLRVYPEDVIRTYFRSGCSGNASLRSAVQQTGLGVALTKHLEFGRQSVFLYHAYLKERPVSAQIPRASSNTISAAQQHRSSSQGS
jgi:hypothetical protein